MSRKKKAGQEVSIVRSSAAEYLTFVAASGSDGVEAIYAEESIWLTQKMMGVLYDVETHTVNYHLKKVFSDSELQEDSVIRNFRITATDGKTYNTKHYNLAAIIAVGYKVNSERAVQFRKWATTIIEEYTIKGFTMDDERLKNGGSILSNQYFEEQLQRIREIRLSERKFYQKITDSHADDIIHTVREEFGEGNDFCKKITYKIDGDPKSVLSEFRNTYYPCIAVTVDMIATGTDVKPLECLLFMRDVKSRNYFDQMKGRGTRTLDEDSLKKVTPSASSAKTHYVIVDAIGVTKSLKTASQPLITKPGVSLKELAMGVMMGAARDEDSVSSLAGRLARLDKQLDDKDRARISEKAGGKPLLLIVGELLDAINPDTIEKKALAMAQQPEGSDPGDDIRDKARDQLVGQAANVFNGELVELIDSIRRDKEQTIVHDDLEMAPFDAKGGMGKMYQLFGDRMDEVIKELNRELVA